jgi:hypothetical protein
VCAIFSYHPAGQFDICVSLCVTSCCNVPRANTYLSAVGRSMTCGRPRTGSPRSIRQVTVASAVFKFYCFHCASYAKLQANGACIFTSPRRTRQVLCSCVQCMYVLASARATVRRSPSQFIITAIAHITAATISLRHGVAKQVGG